MAEAATITKTSNGSHPTLTLDAAVVGAESRGSTSSICCAIRD